MFEHYNTQLTVVIYDSVTNSVFKSQVLEPLLNRLAQDPQLEITLISFEKQDYNQPDLQTIIPAHDRLHVLIFPRLPFVGKPSLYYARHHLVRLMSQIPSDQIIARGPLAGWIVLSSLTKIIEKYPEQFREDAVGDLPRVTIQARGLAAEEYRFTHLNDDQSWISKKWHAYVYGMLHKIEQETYSFEEFPLDCSIESVSHALSTYLTNEFGTPSHAITIAKNDIPKPIDTDQRLTWREEIRTKLGISPTAYVYCYSGSVKPWQCVAESIFYFLEVYQKNQSVVLLLLSQDVKKLIELIGGTGLPESAYRICSVAPADLYKYLSAADAGFLLRQRDIINWVSRPTKLLEYQAVGLEVIHNGTVGILANKP